MDFVFLQKTGTCWSTASAFKPHGSMRGDDCPFRKDIMSRTHTDTTERDSAVRGPCVASAGLQVCRFAAAPFLLKQHQRQPCVGSDSHLWFSFPSPSSSLSLTLRVGICICWQILVRRSEYTVCHKRPHLTLAYFKFQHISIFFKNVHVYQRSRLYHYHG